MIVEIVYFKASGKYYTSELHPFVADEWNAVVDEARALLERGEWPGLAGSDLTFSVLLMLSPPHLFPAGSIKRSIPAIYPGASRA